MADARSVVDWESRERSAAVLLTYVLVTWNIQLWMLPLLLFTLILWWAEQCAVRYMIAIAGECWF